MDFDGGLRRLRELRGPVDGLCAYALVAAPRRWLVAAVKTLDAIGIDGAAAVRERRHYFARWAYQLRQLSRMQPRAARLTVFRSEDAPALLAALLGEVRGEERGGVRGASALAVAARQEAGQKGAAA
eukprot:5456962-Prymnesium_polylepis.1